MIKSGIRDLIFSSLVDYIDRIHAVVLYGSHVHGGSDEDSDTDVAVICPDDIVRDVRRHVIHIEDRSEEAQLSFAVFGLSYAERVIAEGSPIGAAITRGIPLVADKTFENLKRLPFPDRPAPSCVSSALERAIGPMWVYDIPELHSEIRRYHAPGGYCTEHACIGHFMGERLARVILRMLYVTLPASGRMPLCKHDVIRFARERYGRTIERPLAKAIEIVRQDREISVDEYELIIPFARRLWHEVLELHTDRHEAANFLCRLRRVFRKVRTEVSGETAHTE